MFFAALKLFEESPEPFLVLGTDAPTLSLNSILRAARALESERRDARPHDVSIVGSEDGGYVLLGLKEPYEALFRDISWSTGTVYQETTRKARVLGFSLHEGEPHYDVDTPEDLSRLEEELKADPRLAPHTAEFLEASACTRGADFWSAPQS